MYKEGNHFTAMWSHKQSTCTDGYSEEIHSLWKETTRWMPLPAVATGKTTLQDWVMLAASPPSLIYM